MWVCAGRLLIKIRKACKPATLAAAGFLWAVSAAGQIVNRPLKREYLPYRLVPCTAASCTTDYSLEYSHSLSISYENDVFAGTDYYYTQGVSIGYTRHYTKHSVPRFVTPFTDTDAYVTYQLTLQAYTPTSITGPQILRGDRPYCGLAYAEIIGDDLNLDSLTSLATRVKVGVLGPAAGAEGIQKAIHRATDDADPKGWSNQIRNDLLLNYQAYLGRSIFSTRNIGLVLGVQADAGTLYNALAAEAGVNAGFFLAKKKGVSMQFQLSGIANLVAYDARLQGGLFNRTSPYVLRGAEIERAVLQCVGNVRLRWKLWSLGYRHTLRTRDFKAGLPHSWGGFLLSVPLGYTK